MNLILALLTKNILRIFFHFIIIPLMLPALLIFLTYMLTCYSFAHLLSGAYHYPEFVLITQ